MTKKTEFHTGGFTHSGPLREGEVPVILTPEYVLPPGLQEQLDARMHRLNRLNPLHRVPNLRWYTIPVLGGRMIVCDVVLDGRVPAGMQLGYSISDSQMREYHDPKWLVANAIGTLTRNALNLKPQMRLSDLVAEKFTQAISAAAVGLLPTGLPEPRIDSIRYTSSKPRRKPQAGDVKFVKKTGKTMIRQQVKIDGAWLVSNHRPVWEWVEKGSERDRTSEAWKAAQAAKAGAR